jgi:hypothetical protein
MVTNNSPDDKSLQTVSFIIHATRGVIRDQKIRRRTMLVVLVGALALLISGSTVLQEMLDPREHPGRFILFWIVCAWFSLTAILLALFDFLMVRLEARNARRALRNAMEETSRGSGPE